MMTIFSPPLAAHKRFCKFSIKNNPGFVRHCIQLLCLTSKQNIMKEQIACRRDNEQNVTKFGGKYEELVNEKNREYMTERNNIKDQILNHPDKLLEKIEGEGNRAFLTFVVLLMFRDDSGNKKKQSPRKAKNEQPLVLFPAASPPRVLPVANPKGEPFSFHNFPRQESAKRTKELGTESSGSGRKIKGDSNDMKSPIATVTRPERESTPPLDLSVRRMDPETGSAPPSFDARKYMDFVWYEMLRQQAFQASQRGVLQYPPPFGLPFWPPPPAAGGNHQPFFPQNVYPFTKFDHNV